MNKNVDKNAYHEASYGKKQLMIVSIVVFIVSLIALIGGIILFVNGIHGHKILGKVLKIVFGVLLILVGLLFGYASFMAFFTSTSMLNNKTMNVKDGNRAKGTLNVLKCDKCGHENEEGAEFCKNCGESLKGYIECECGTRNPTDAEYCSTCGKKLK